MKLACLAIGLGCLALPAAQARPRPTPETLECNDLRRLSDNFLLDLRIRMVFSKARHSYVRLENTGRGWQTVDERPFVAFEPTRILLADTPFYKSYVERLTGDYYHIDHTGTGLSVWGRCGRIGGTSRMF